MRFATETEMQCAAEAREERIARFLRVGTFEGRVATEYARVGKFLRDCPNAMGEVRMMVAEAISEGGERCFPAVIAGVSCEVIVDRDDPWDDAYLLECIVDGLEGRGGFSR